LDTFLPKDDPRNEEADIADRFDSVFWCGDRESAQASVESLLISVNFRLDMSRLHAQWLVEQKSMSTRCTVTDGRLPRAFDVGPTSRSHEGS
jgi:hypothetical protein